VIEYLRDKLRVVGVFFRNMLVFKRTLIGHRPTGYLGLLIGMRDALEDMESVQRKTNRLRQTKKMCKKMRVVLFSLNRLIKDEYGYDWVNIDINLDAELIEGEFYSHEGLLKETKLKDLPSLKAQRKLAIKLREQDLRIVGEAFSKGHVLCFWD